MTAGQPTPAAPGVLTSLELERRDHLKPAAVQRHFSAWDALGILLLTFVMLVANRLAVAYVGTQLGRSRWIHLITLASGVITLAGLAWLTLRDRQGISAIPRRVLAVWRDPPGDWAAFALGALLATPLLGLYAPILFNDADSARLVASVRYVQGGTFGYFPETQEPLLPHVLLGPSIALRGLAGAKLFAIASVQTLCGVTALLTRRITGSMWGAGAAALGLLSLSAVLERATHLPMYSTMLALGYFGSWLAYRAMTTPQAHWRYVLPAGLCLALAPEAHGVGQLFLAVPFLLVVFAPTAGTGMAQMGRTYATILVVSLPRIVINLSEGPLATFAGSRTDYWVTNGYVSEIQRRFWGPKLYIGIDEGAGEYVTRLPERYLDSLGAQGWLVVVLAGIAWLLCTRGRARWFVIAVVAFMALALTIKRVPPFSRYYSPLWPGMAILVGVLVGSLARRRTLLTRLGAAFCSVVLVAAAAVTYRDSARGFDRVRHAVDTSAYPSLAAAIDDGKGVIGARAHQALMSVSTNIQTWGDQFLTEDEYVTYLTWPSDNVVIEMLERHNIGWVLIHPYLPLELLYNDTWLVPYHGKSARHVDAIAMSPRFCKYLEVGGFVLYKLGSCTPNPSSTTFPTRGAAPMPDVDA
jgi:hypothetical protein